MCKIINFEDARNVILLANTAPDLGVRGLAFGHKKTALPGAAAVLEHTICIVHHVERKFKKEDGNA